MAEWGPKLAILLCLLLGILLGMWVRGDQMVIYLAENVQRVTGLVLPSPAGCQTDVDCEWVITNCCPEMAGAHWECVNVRAWQPPICRPDVVCAQVISPRPDTPCECVAGKCVAG